MEEEHARAPAEYGARARDEDVVERAFREAGYDLPEIVYWNLSTGATTNPVTSERKGVALMSGFSPAMLKVFMGDADAEDVAEEREESTARPDPNAEQAQEKRFDPLSMMKKALSKASFDGLVVVD